MSCSGNRCALTSGRFVVWPAKRPAYVSEGVTQMLVLLLLLLSGGFAHGQESYSTRVKDLAYIRGVRENQLAGVGLVTGLDGRGDSANSEMLKATVSNLLGSFGISVSAEDVRSRNCAVVTVTADLPSFVRPGDRISVHVSSIGDAKDLNGGVLLQANLKAANGDVYAVAQGSVASSSVENSPKTVGVVPGGAIVEREVLSSFSDDDYASIVLRNPDFSNAAAIAEALRSRIPNAEIRAIDASLVQVEIPEERADDPVAFLAEVESVTIEPSVEARVVINPRSGIIVLGTDVRIGEVAVSYGKTRLSVSSVVPTRSSMNVESTTVLRGTTIGELVDTLQAVGLPADTVIEIIKAIDRAGALYGRLIIM